MQRKEYGREKGTRDASSFRVGVVVAQFNADITNALLEGTLETLRAWKVPSRSIEVVKVPGSFEIPFGCLTFLSRKRKPDCLVALGCIIKGETDHDRYIASAVSDGIMALSLEHRVPISFGVITTNNLQQAKARSTGKTNKGIEAAVAALESAFIAKRKNQ